MGVTLKDSIKFNKKFKNFRKDIEKAVKDAKDYEITIKNEPIKVCWAKLDEHNEWNPPYDVKVIKLDDLKILKIPLQNAIDALVNEKEAYKYNESYKIAEELNKELALLRELRCLIE